jgi:hypothetical protein
MIWPFARLLAIRRDNPTQVDRRASGAESLIRTNRPGYRVPQLEVEHAVALLSFDRGQCTRSHGR